MTMTATSHSVWRSGMQPGTPNRPEAKTYPDFCKNSPPVSAFDYRAGEDPFVLMRIFIPIHEPVTAMNSIPIPAISR